MSPNDLESRFPDMRPIQKVPSLGLFHGCGLTLYGSRDQDPETGTCVKTHCFCLVGIPLFTLGAYRVAELPQGCYILGRVPLSALARAWNYVVLLALLGLGGGFGWHWYTGTPQYVARQKLDQAAQLTQAGQLGKAARLLREVALGKTEHARTAAEQLNGLLDGPAAAAALTEVAEACTIAVELQLRPIAGVAQV